MSREAKRTSRKHVRLPGVAVPLSLLVLLAVSACQDAATAAGTALYVTTEFDPLLQLTQFRVTGDVDDGSGIPSSLLPESAGRILESGETFRVLLPDATDGAQATLRLEGLSGTDVAAVGTATATVREGYEVDVSVELVPQSVDPDAGTPDSGTPDSGTPDSGPGNSCLDCADGCCRNNACVPRTFMTCGVGGVACTACDPGRASACSPQGFCACGSGPACSGPGVDRCTNGECKCGSSGPCGPGQECVGGTCRCTPTSCPSGCCAGNTCEPGNEQSKCGTRGQACNQCRRSCEEDRTCK
ncbi:hypothetical protein [Pyxidicoccus xibeiensis]|uniref:hypothetical protein n=1 Tax=Pyxidicoccus xibeiensis TaxID=2906759 RepID=UPI0020A73E3A|nr:hypothetical protein [Pyxidicoccus xibeiensis]MCP3136239.1 hypothetical protein [Pyxidicoccus xibeiensis]